jgi:transcriptional regulator with XRE-family HTH domain
MSFGRRIKQLREEKGVRQEDIGNLFSVSKSAVSQWENDIRTPDMDIIIKLADFFDVSTDYLLGRTNDPSLSDTQHVNDDEALEYLDELHKRPEMKTLFEVGRKATKEDIETAITVIEALKKKGGNNE